MTTANDNIRPCMREGNPLDWMLTAQEKAWIEEARLEELRMKSEYNEEGWMRA